MGSNPTLSADLPMLHLYSGKDETIRHDGTAGLDDGFMYATAAETTAVWAEALACEDGPHEWGTEVSSDAGLQCTAYSNCRTPGQEVVGCMDPEETHRWPSQQIEGADARCVTTEQYASLPDQHRCEPADGAYEHLGMDLIWNFFRRYRRSDRTAAE